MLKLRNRVLKQFTLKLLPIALLAMLWSVTEAIIPFTLKFGLDALITSLKTKSLYAHPISNILTVYFILIVFTESCMRVGNFLYQQNVPRLCQDIECYVVDCVIKTSQIIEGQDDANLFTHDIKNLVASIETCVRLSLYGLFPLTCAYCTTALLLLSISSLLSMLYVAWFISMIILTFISRSKLIQHAESTISTQNAYFHQVGDVFNNLSTVRQFRQEASESSRLSFFHKMFYATLDKENSFILKINLLRTVLTIVLIGVTIQLILQQLIIEPLKAGNIAFLMIATLSMRKDTWSASIFIMDILKQVGIIKDS